MHDLPIERTAAHFRAAPGRKLLFGLAIAIMLGLLTASCAGFKDISYFAAIARPDVTVGPGWGGPSDQVVAYPLSKTVRLSLIIFDHPGQSSLRVIFDLPQGESLRFENASFVASSLDGGNKMAAQIDTIWANYIVNGRGNVKYLAPGDDLIGASHEYKPILGGPVAVPRRFQIDVKFLTPLPDKFTLQIPSAKFSGKAIVFPEVEFRRKMGSFYQSGPP